MGDELQTQMVGISRASWGQISSLPCLNSPAPTPTEPPRDVSACNSTRFGKPPVLIEAGHGLISSHSTISGPCRIGASREKGWGVSAGDVCVKTVLF